MLFIDMVEALRSPGESDVAMAYRLFGGIYKEPYLSLRAWREGRGKPCGKRVQLVAGVLGISENDLHIILRGETPEQHRERKSQAEKAKTRFMYASDADYRAKCLRRNRSQSAKRRKESNTFRAWKSRIMARIPEDCQGFLLKEYERVARANWRDKCREEAAPRVLAKKVAREKREKALDTIRKLRTEISQMRLEVARSAYCLERYMGCRSRKEAYRFGVPWVVAKDRRTWQLGRSRRRAKANGADIRTERVRSWVKIVRSFGSRCVYCGAGGGMELDHIVPLSKGGGHHVGNFAPACKRCNSSKNNNDFMEWAIRTKSTITARVAFMYSLEMERIGASA